MGYLQTDSATAAKNYCVRCISCGEVHAALAVDFRCLKCGDLLEVNFALTAEEANDVTLLGPAEYVFQGDLDYPGKQ